MRFTQSTYVRWLIKGLQGAVNMLRYAIEEGDPLHSEEIRDLHEAELQFKQLLDKAESQVRE